MINKSNSDPSTTENKGPGVSELLRTTRERAGEDLQTVCQVLRIRLVYLQAIEDGRYEDLPGKTYVVGFVRAYAEHLGLDVEEVVNRFKQEVDGLEGKADLVFPSPATEQSVPGGALILISLIVVGAVYGAWYFMSSQDRDMAELVPDLPAKFAQMVKDKPVDDTEKTEEKAAEPETVVSVTEEASEAVSSQDVGDMAQKALDAVENAEESEQDVNVETVVVETEEAANAVASGQVEEADEESLAESVVNVIEQVEEQVQAVIETEEAEVEPVQQEEVQSAPQETAVEEVIEEVRETDETAALSTEGTTQEPAQEETTAETENTTETDVTADEEAPAEPVVPAVMDAKIVLKAVDYSWIQIVESNGTVVHTQALNQGDEYETPRTAGLILRTGNAGGLEIFVDDEKVPSIGEFGEVRRRVVMDPQRLKSGRAVER